MIAGYLIRVDIPCFDVGLGLEVVDDKLRNATRIMTAPGEYSGNRSPSGKSDVRRKLFREPIFRPSSSE